jgi:Mg-chelatase subunit ChlD
VPDESEEIEQMSQAQSEEQSEGEPRADYSAQEAAVDHRKQQMELGEMIQQTLSPNAEDGGDNSEMNLDQESIANIEVLMRVLKGRIERNVAEKVPHLGGQPRKWRRMHTFHDILDTDPVESAIWYDHITPQLPRVLLRERFDRGGDLAILRDISSSMAGIYSKWASSVILRLIELARKKRMRVGYIEFNHLSTKYQVEGKFFVRDYDKMAHRALALHCSGCTNYQNSLEDALMEFKRLGRGNQHILFLTDGVPTQGDWEVKHERVLAQELGVSIHTIFIGKNKCPRILEIISEESEGAQFQASTDRHGVIRIEERNKPEYNVPSAAGV